MPYATTRISREPIKMQALSDIRWIWLTLFFLSVSHWVLSLILVISRPSRLRPHDDSPETLMKRDHGWFGCSHARNLQRWWQDIFGQNSPFSCFQSMCGCCRTVFVAVGVFLFVCFYCCCCLLLWCGWPHTCRSSSCSITPTSIEYASFSHSMNFVDVDKPKNNGPTQNKQEVTSTTKMTCRQKSNSCSNTWLHHSRRHKSKSGHTVRFWFTTFFHQLISTHIPDDWVSHTSSGWFGFGCLNRFTWTTGTQFIQLMALERCGTNWFPWDRCIRHNTSYSANSFQIH